MGDSTIEWTDKTWNPLAGCEFVSDGCTGCYAARDAFGRLKASPTYAGLAIKRTPDELPRFTGEVRLLRDRLDQPLHWREPKRVFVNSMSDLFHKDVPEEFIAEVFAVMSLAPQHQFQVLTKRPERVEALFDRRRMWRPSTGEPVQHAFVESVDAARVRLDPKRAGDFYWPLPNVWIGTSVENQRYADIRIPHLLRTIAAVRFLSIEPLLGPVDLRPWLAQFVKMAKRSGAESPMPSIDWVIVGGESGHGARPMHPEWVRTIRDQCFAAGVPFLFKQWGEWRPLSGPDDWNHPHGCYVHPDGTTVAWPGRYDPVADGAMVRPGKKAAGRVLDGRTWDEYPA